MRHAAREWEGSFGHSERARRSDGSTSACSSRAWLAAHHFRLAEASQFSALFCRTTRFLNRHLDAEHGARLAGVSTNRLEAIAGSSGGSRVDADDALFGLGRL